jgi:uncharacterized protein YegL
VTNPSYTHLAFVVDRSGSMRGIAADMEGGIKQLLADQASVPGEVHVDITTFDDEIERPYENVRPDDVKGKIITPRGSTALLDALGVTIVKLGETLAALDEGDRPSNVVIVVVTDGMENASQEYTAEQIAAMVKEQTRDFGWQFQFLGANIDAFQVAGNLGFAQGQTMNYSATSKGSRNGMAAASASIIRTRSGLDGSYTEDERTASGL